MMNGRNLGMAAILLGCWLGMERSGRAQADRLQPPREGAVAPIGPESQPLIQAPPWVPLPPAHEQHLQEILRYWENEARKIERYECQFTHWVFGMDKNHQPLLDANGREAAQEIYRGTIKYMAPDKGMYQVKDAWTLDLPTKQHTKESLERMGQHWICDGRYIYEFNYRQKELRKIELPPDARGDAISRGPIPFLFRASNQEIQSRFWLRVITPKGVENEYHLEAVPKSQGDRAQFSSAILIIAQEDFLPKAIIMFPPAAVEGAPKRDQYVFENRKVNWTFTDVLQGLKFWARDFFDPPTPDGWRLIEQPFADAHSLPAAPPTAPRTAGR
jgi:TIGR03009 family protein